MESIGTKARNGTVLLLPVEIRYRAFTASRGSRLIPCSRIRYMVIRRLIQWDWARPSPYLVGSRTGAPSASTSRCGKIQPLRSRSHNHVSSPRLPAEVSLSRQGPAYSARLQYIFRSGRADAGGSDMSPESPDSRAASLCFTYGRAETGVAKACSEFLNELLPARSSDRVPENSRYAMLLSSRRSLRVARGHLCVHLVRTGRHHREHVYSPLDLKRPGSYLRFTRHRSRRRSGASLPVAKQSGSHNHVKATHARLLHVEAASLRFTFARSCTIGAFLISPLPPSKAIRRCVTPVLPTSPSRFPGQRPTFARRGAREGFSSCLARPRPYRYHAECRSGVCAAMLLSSKT